MQPHSRFYDFKPDFREPFGRDRDRIIHSSSFRKLEYKTQVFPNQSGDYFRTRLTHSLEVSQIARTLSEALRLNANLAEAIALAHDLGHTPFGHCGGDELDRVMKKYGYRCGFDHNFQSFRVVTSLEKRYQEFEGINLTFGTLEGILKHSYPYEKPFLNASLRSLFKTDFHPSLEAIIVDLSDEIAYLSHDIDDGIKCGLISFKDLKSSQLASEVIAYIREKEKITQEEKIFRHRFTSRLITLLVYDILENISPFTQESPQCAIYKANEPVRIAHTQKMQESIEELKVVLLERLYHHEEINRKMYLGKKCIKSLYECFCDEPSLLPKDWQERIQNGGKIHRICADFIASMSDRYALKIYKELGFG